MTIKTSLRRSILPVLSAALLATSAHANKAPQVAVNGLTGNGLMFNGAVQVSGVTGDQHGIREIYGTIQKVDTGMFFTPGGKFVKDPSRLPYKFERNVAKTTWTTDALRVPPGNYIYRMRVEDGQELRSEIIEIPLRVAGGAVVNRTTALVKPAARQPVAQQQVKQNTQMAKPAGTMAVNGMPYCANAGMDADGDGFGWQNNASCIVAGSKADKHPNCATAGSDPDGDGWGWENERSCVVVTHCKSAGSDPDGDGFGWENNKSCIVVSTAGKHPPCANAASDPDGDGYGWENNKTCLVQR